MSLRVRWMCQCISACAMSWQCLGFIIEPLFYNHGQKILQKYNRHCSLFVVLPYLTSHWQRPQRLPQINVEARSRDVSFLCLLGIGLGERSQQTLTKIAASATREFEKIVTPSNCAVVTVSQKEVSSVRVACWKPKPRCGIWPQTKIRNVQLRSPVPHLWCCTFHMNSCNMQQAPYFAAWRL